MVTAESSGAWGTGLRITVVHGPADATGTVPFSLCVNEVDPAGGAIRLAEAHSGLSPDPASGR
ncbi:hypothetical protein GCM10023166_09380 [Paeniglutamicibacter cryotolerans]